LEPQKKSYNRIGRNMAIGGGKGESHVAKALGKEGLLGFRKVNFTEDRGPATIQMGYGGWVTWGTVIEGCSLFKKGGPFQGWKKFFKGGGSFEGDPLRGRFSGPKKGLLKGNKEFWASRGHHGKNKDQEKKENTSQKSNGGRGTKKLFISAKFSRFRTESESGGGPCLGRPAAPERVSLGGFWGREENPAGGTVAKREYGLGMGLM